MKWFKNKEMLQDILEQNKNELEKYKNDKIVALLKDESNLIQDHLILLDENEKLKKEITNIEDYCNLIIESLKEKISMCFEEIDYPLGLVDKLHGKLEAYQEISYRLKEVLKND